MTVSPLRHFAIVAVALVGLTANLAAQEASTSSDKKTDSVPKAQPVPKAQAVSKEELKNKAKETLTRSTAPAVRPLTVTVDLLSQTRLDGTLTDATTLEMRTSFGAASIPLSEVAGIRFASADNATTTVVMLNGDSITGATDVKLVTIETEWGTASINGPNIASMMFVPGLSWNPEDGLNGQRWKLITKSSPKPPAPKPEPAANASSNNGSVIRSAPVNNGYPATTYPPASSFRTR